MLTLCKEIVVFLLLAKMLESFQIGNKYGKFVKLVISLIVVLKIITPVFSFFDREFDFEKIVTQMEQRLVLDEENMETTDYTEPIETVDIAGTKIRVEEIQWKK